MTIKSLIDQAFELAGSTVSQETMLSWLSDIDGQIAYDCLGVDLILPYDEDDLGSEPVVGDPWGRNIYEPYLEAMIYYTHGEIDRYVNAKTMHTQNYLEFRKWLRRTLSAPCCCAKPREVINSVRLEDPLNVYHE